MMLAQTVHQNFTVVIADDFVPLRSLLRSQLEAYGFQIVLEASDGLEAVAKTVESRADLVLLDIAMPGLNGIEAAARIRLLAPQSKIIFISQNSDPDVAQWGLSAGVGGYVVKSSMGSELLPAIEAVLEGHQFVSAGLHLASAPALSRA